MDVRGLRAITRVEEQTIRANAFDSRRHHEKETLYANLTCSMFQEALLLYPIQEISHAYATFVFTFS